MNPRATMVIGVAFLMTAIYSINLTYAQYEQDIDSLRQVVAEMEASKEKADEIVALGELFYRQKEYDSALVHAEQAQVLADKFDHQLCIADVLYLKSKIFDKLDNQVESINAAREYLEMVLPLNDSVRLGRAYYQYGHMLQDHGENDSAALYLKECLAINIAKKDTGNAMVLYNAIGNLYQDYSEYDSAAIYYLKSIHLAEASGRIHSLAKLYNNLGKVFIRLNDLNEARRYLEIALEMNEDNDDDYTTAIILNNIGHTYLKSDDPDMAMVYYDRAWEQYRKFGDRIGLYDLYNNYALVYKTKGNYKKAITSLDKALEGYNRFNYVEGIALALKNMGEMNSLLGRYASARIYLDSALMICRNSGYKQLEYEAMEIMAKNYMKMGNYKKAYESEIERFELYKELFDIEKEETIKDLKFKYEKEKDQAEILALQNTNLEMELELRRKTTQRNSYLVASLGILVIGLFVFIYLRQRVIIGRQKIAQLEEEKKLMEVRLLVEGQELERKRIARELHDGLGVLLSATKMQFTSIKDASPENKLLIEKATQLLEQATGDVRKISHNMMPGLLTKLGFYEAIEELMENIDESDDIKASCEIIGERVRMSENNEIMLYRVIQEMINNTLKHAKASRIDLEIKILPDHLHVKYADDGVGFDSAKAFEKGSRSLGLRNMQTRVQFMNGDMDITTEPGKGTEYSLDLPL